MNGSTIGLIVTFYVMIGWVVFGAFYIEGSKSAKAAWGFTIAWPVFMVLYVVKAVRQAFREF
jgi:hypothetical protein